MNSELAKYLDKNRYVLKHREVESGVVGDLLQSGLEVITVCYAGQGRSPMVAEFLARLDVPAIALEGGIRKLEYVEDDSIILREVNKFPRISIILDWGERQEFATQIARLNVNRTFDDHEIAFRQLSIENMST